MKDQAQTPITLDGRTGEGGGQLVRLAVSLSAVATVPVRITHVRGNRGSGVRGGGLKAQHVASIAYLAAATDALVDGLHVGSDTLEFRPRRRPDELVVVAEQGTGTGAGGRRRRRKVKIVAGSAAASTLLIFQAVFPFLLFAGREEGGEGGGEGGDDRIEVEIEGGTNVSWSLSWEYLDQVLLPTLEERFGIAVERRLVRRGWSAGPASEAGKVWLCVSPVPVGRTVRPREDPRKEGYTARDFEVRTVDVSILAPGDMHAALQEALVADLETVCPKAAVEFRVVEDTVYDSRVYVLCVARSETGLRWGRDCLSAVGKKARKADVVRKISRKVCKELYEEVAARGTVDEYLQDQLVVFQALADGKTSFPRSGLTAGSKDDMDEALADLTAGDRMRRDKVHEPFGEGSTHTTTARWVTAELLGQVGWHNKGRVCQGAGIHMGRPV